MVNVLVVNDARLFPLTFTVARTVVPSRNCTVPAGVWPVSESVTAARKLIGVYSHDSERDEIA
jgi:hypothetical protein